MTRITDAMLQGKLRQINAALGTPQSPWETKLSIKASQISATTHAVGCIFLDNAYGGLSIRRMEQTGGESTVVTGGYFTKREVMMQLEGFYNGILAGRQKIPRKGYEG